MKVPSRTTVASLVLGLLVLGMLGRPALASNDPLAEAQAVHDLGDALLDAGAALEDAERIRKALAKFQEAETLYVARLEAATRRPSAAGLERRIERQLKAARERIEFCREFLELLKLGGTSKAPTPAPEPEPTPQPEAAPPAPAPGIAAGTDEGPKPGAQETLSRWVLRVERTYEDEPTPGGRATMARAIGREAGLVGVPTLGRLFRTEKAPLAREGIHEALATVGTSRVAGFMASFAVRGMAERWDDALDVIYRCLEKPEAQEPERPFLLAVRRFHELKNRQLSLSIVDRLDAMGTPGVAALGQILYVQDVGYHDHVISLLATKRDGRAVPPLIHKMNRFKFDRSVQMPAHHALLQLGWYAVEELINHLDDKAAGIWISWTLRKITGDASGTQKRKWHEWWKTEKLRHPELLLDPEERPASQAPQGGGCGGPHGLPPGVPPPTR